MQRFITRGAAANAGLIFHIFVQDSTSTTGAGKSGIAFGSFTVYYIRTGEALSGAITPQDITTIGTYAAPTANTNIRIKEVSAANMPGVYEVQLHLDWVNTTNSCQALTIYFSASGAAVRPWTIPLEAVNRQSATAFITGINSLAPPTNWNLISIDANGRLDIIKIAGTSQTARDIGASVLLSTGTGAGQLDFTSGRVKSDVAYWDAAAVATPDTAGYPKTTIKSGVGTGEVSLSAGLVTPTAAVIDQIVDETWDELIAGHLGAGSTGAALNAAGGAGDPWTTSIPGAYGAGTAGYILGNNVNATISSRATDAGVWAVGTRTLTSFGTLVADIWANATRTLSSYGSLTTDTATAVWANATRTLSSYGTLVADISTAVWAESVRTLTSFGTLVTDIWAAGTRTLTSFGTLVTDIWTASTAATPANVLTQVNSALDAAGSELSATVTSTGSVRQKLNWLFQYFKLKRTVTATQEKMYKVDATTVLQTSTISDDATTFTKTEGS